MFISLSTVRAFHIVQFMRTSNHQFHYDCVVHKVHENAAVTGDMDGDTDVDGAHSRSGLRSIF